MATVMGIGEMCSGNRCCNLVCYVLFDCNAWPNDTLADINRVTAMFLVAVIGGGIPYGALSALEWVYRGFRPKKTE